MTVRALDESWERVRRLVERHPKDWEGQDLGGEAALRVFASGQRPPRRVLVVTKEAPVRRWSRSDWPPGLVVVVASGNLTRPQVAALGALASDKSVPVVFVGDADPMALHTFQCLRVYLGSRRVRFCGICDAVLDALGDELVQPDRLRALDLSVFDQEHLAVVTALEKPERVLGPRVAAVLRGGRKIEIEALSFRADLTPALFQAALQVSGAGASGRTTRRRRRAAR